RPMCAQPARASPSTWQRWCARCSVSRAWKAWCCSAQGAVSRCFLPSTTRLPRRSSVRHAKHASPPTKRCATCMAEAAPPASTADSSAVCRHGVTFHHSFETGVDEPGADRTSLDNLSWDGRPGVIAAIDAFGYECTSPTGASEAGTQGILGRRPWGSISELGGTDVNL